MSIRALVRLSALSLLLAAPLALTGCPDNAKSGATMASCFARCKAELQEELQALQQRGQLPGLALEKKEEACKAACHAEHGS